VSVMEGDEVGWKPRMQSGGGASGGVGRRAQRRRSEQRVAQERERHKNPQPRGRLEWQT
jgi:hypothetical protein